MSVVSEVIPAPPVRMPGASLALAAVCPLAVGAILAARAEAVSPLAVAPAIVFGVVAATSPALYIAIAATGDAPPLARVMRALVVALAAFGCALAGLVLPAAFLSLSSTGSLTTVVVCSAALGTAAIVAMFRLSSELGTRTLTAWFVFVGWAIATLVIAGRLWWDFAAEVLS
ncbi:MAG TPA: hypothetical protein VFQ53_19040 [Kofleriaceae bacterium]|nr:hypothetical protein [Kofleriaceae bacterium]